MAGDDTPDRRRRRRSRDTEESQDEEAESKSEEKSDETQDRQDSRGPSRRKSSRRRRRRTADADTDSETEQANNPDTENQVAQAPEEKSGGSHPDTEPEDGDTDSSEGQVGSDAEDSSTEDTDETGSVTDDETQVTEPLENEGDVGNNSETSGESGTDDPFAEPDEWDTVELGGSDESSSEDTTESETDTDHSVSSPSEWIEEDVSTDVEEDTEESRSEPETAPDSEADESLPSSSEGVSPDEDTTGVQAHQTGEAGSDEESRPEDKEVAAENDAEDTETDLEKSQTGSNSMSDSTVEDDSQDTPESSLVDDGPSQPDVDEDANEESPETNSESTIRERRSRARGQEKEKREKRDSLDRRRERRRARKMKRESEEIDVSEIDTETVYLDEEKEEQEASLQIKLSNRGASLLRARHNLTRENLTHSLTDLGSRWFERFLLPRSDSFEGLKTRLKAAKIPYDWDEWAALSIVVALFTAIGTLLTVAAGGTLVGLSSVMIGVGAILLPVALGASAGAWVFYLTPLRKAHKREREIDLLLPHATAYMFGQAQGDVSLVDIIESLAQEQGRFGPVAEEFTVVSNEMNAFNSDLRTALRQGRESTPSMPLAEMFDELINVIETSGQTAGYFREKTEEFENRAVEQERRMINSLEGISQAYIIFGLVGPILGIIVLLVLSLMGSYDIGYAPLFVLVYVYIPLVSTSFIVIVNSLTADDSSTEPLLETDYSGTDADWLKRLLYHDKQLRSEGDPQTDGGVTAGNDNPRVTASRNRQELTELNDVERSRLISLRRAAIWDSVGRAARNLPKHLSRNPSDTLYLTLPVALLTAILFQGLGVASLTPDAMLRDPVYHSTMMYVLPFFIGFAPYSYWYRKHRLHNKRVRGTLPVMLRKLSSATEAGTPLVGSIRAVGETADDYLAVEVQKMKHEIENYSVTVDESLRRMANRVKNPRMTRVTKLLIEANTASGHVRDVLEVAAQDAQNATKLDRERYSAMQMTMVVIIVAYLTFLIIVVIFEFYLQPHLVEMNQIASEQEVGFAAQFDEALFSLILHHAMLATATFGGLLAGVFGYGKKGAGVIWSLVFLLAGTLTYYISPVVF
jgi:flagellar protein FlaJ